MPAYRVSNRAQSDLLLIGRFTAREWGLAQRNFYLKQIDDCFSELAENPNLGMACDYISRGYRKIPQGRHVIFYKQGSGGIIEIIRVLHQSMDVESKL